MDKEKYIEFCNKHESIPIFMEHWWLDAVCGKDNWNVIISETSNEIHSVWPFYIHKSIISTIKTPLLTPRLGPLFNYPSDMKYESKLSFEKKQINELLQKLPKHHLLKIGLDYSLQNWLPFYWAGYSQSTRYSYIIDDLSDLERVKKSFKENIRREIKKAQKKVTINETNDVSILYNLNLKTFVRQNLKPPYTLKFIENLHKVLVEKNRCKILYAIDKNNQTHAAVLLVWDKNFMYYLIGGGDPALRNSGATSLILWEAIQLASEKGLKFDFEGSMIEPIERFFRSFGTKQVPFSVVSKAQSKATFRLLKIKELLQGKELL